MAKMICTGADVRLCHAWRARGGMRTLSPCVNVYRTPSIYTSTDSPECRNATSSPSWLR